MSLTQTGVVALGALQIQCDAFSVNQNDAAADQLLSGAIVFGVALKRGEWQDKLHRVAG